jgi:hypothetical protein
VFAADSARHSRAYAGASCIDPTNAVVKVLLGWLFQGGFLASSQRRRAAGGERCLGCLQESAPSALRNCSSHIDIEALTVRWSEDAI